jgi:hypothetical protein
MDRIILELEGVVEHCSEPARRVEIVRRLTEYRAGGARIVLCSSVGAGLVPPDAARTIDSLLETATDYGVPCDELFLGDPGASDALLVIDDKAITFAELVEYDAAGIARILQAEAAVA